MTIKTTAAIAAFLLIATQANASNCYETGCAVSHSYHAYKHKSHKHHTHKHKRYLSPLKKAVTHKEKIAPLSHVAEKPETPISGLAAQARRYLGMDARQLGLRRTLWCSAFLRMLTKAKGVDDRAISWINKERIKPTINAIAVMAHHVGIVMGFNKDKVILISGNHSHKVGISGYHMSRIIAYVKV